MDSSMHIAAARTPGIFLFTVLFAAISPAGVAEVTSEGEALSYLSAASDDELPPHAMRGRGARVRIEPTEIDVDRLEFRFPDGTRRMARRNRMINHGTLKTWVGEFEGRPGSFAVMSHRDGETTGFLDDGQRIFEIRPGPAGETLLYEVDIAALPPPGSPLSPPINGPGSSTQKSTQAETQADTAAPAQGPTQAPMLQESNTAATLNALAPQMADTAGGVVQDIMLLYTPAVRNYYGNASVTESVLRDAVLVTNQAYIDSDIDIELNVVYLEELDIPVTGDLSETLNQLREEDDGVVDDIHIWRDVYGADLVALITLEDDPESCGLAYRPYGGFSFSEFDSFMFSAIEPQCLSSGTLAHEIGHNQGVCHDRGDPGGCEGPDAPAFFPYGWGYCGINLGTLMAATTSCRLSRIRQFSNPNIMVAGEPIGIDFDVDPENSADAARSINNTAAALAAFRFPDADLDGMSDEWETANGFAPSDASDAAGDVDMDGLSNVGEFQADSDPRNPDTDGDGFLDNVDALPRDPTESLDTDGDGIGNNADTDDDNDGVPDREDDFPLDAGLSMASGGSTALSLPTLILLFLLPLLFRTARRPGSTNLAVI